MQCAYFKDKGKWAAVSNYLPGSRGANFENNNIKCCQVNGNCFTDNVSCYAQQGNIDVGVTVQENANGFPAFRPVMGGCVAPNKPTTFTTCPQYTCADKTLQPICSSTACNDCVCGAPFVKYGDPISLRAMNSLVSSNAKPTSGFPVNGLLTLSQSSDSTIDDVIVDDLQNTPFTFESADYTKSDGDVVAYDDNVFLVVKNKKIGLTNTVDKVDVAGIKTSGSVTAYKFVIKAAFSFMNWTPRRALRQGDQFCLKVGGDFSNYGPYLSVVKVPSGKICLGANNGTFDPTTNSGSTVTQFAAFNTKGDVDYIPAGLICTSSTICPANQACENGMCVSTLPPPPPPPPPVVKCGVINGQSFPDCSDDKTCVNNQCVLVPDTNAPSPTAPSSTSAWYTDPKKVIIISICSIFFVILLGLFFGRKKN